MRMKKILLWILTIGVLGVMPDFGSFAAFAAGEEARVIDQADLFSDGEREELETELSAARKNMGMDLAVLTIDDAGGKTAEEYADDYYDSEKLGRGFKDSGALCLIDMDNREIYISTYGDMERYLTDERIQEILDDAYGYVSEGEYAQCASSMVQGIDGFVAAGIVEGQYNYDEETGRSDYYRKRSVAWYEALFALLAAGTMALLPCISTVKRYKMEAEQKQALNFHMAYRATSAFAFNVTNDLFINKVLSQRRIVRSTGSGGSGRSHSGHSSSGRSTVHRSSSGRSHGGGGRRF